MRLSQKSSLLSIKAKRPLSFISWQSIRLFAVSGDFIQAVAWYLPEEVK